MSDDNSGKFNSLMPNTLVIPARLSNNNIIHIVIMLIVNTAIVTTLLSIYDFAIFYDKYTVLVYTLVYTSIEFIVKTISFKSLIKYIAMTYGLILFIENILLFAVVDSFFGYDFYFQSLDKLLLFVVIFTIIRLIILNYINKKLMIRRMKKAVRWLDGKKQSKY